MARRRNLSSSGSKYTRFHKSSLGFTLIELLVVISIMSMLMSIVMPVASRAREQAYRIDCLSNMRQLTFAWGLYAEYNDDRLCSPDTFWNNPGQDHHWVADGPALLGNSTGGTKTAIKDGVLWPYTMETLGVYECTSARSSRSVNSRPDRLRDYSISNTMGGHLGTGVRPFRILSEIPRPAEKMVFIDADGGLCGTTAGIDRFYWLSGSFWPLEINSGPPEWHFERGPDGVADNIITARHSDGCNLSFADVHCEHWRWKDKRTVKLANDEISEQNASVENPDLKRMVHVLKGH